ncbi:MAG TPA: hypothetical protein GX517_05530 [Alicyclobacillus sp.]|nr:hypothetical protein [Alicyclobacillus sp.]
MALGISVSKWADLPKGRKAVLFDDTESFTAYAAFYERDEDGVRARRIHPQSIQWARAFDVVVFVGRNYELWEPFLDFRHYVLPLPVELVDS